MSGRVVQLHGNELRFYESDGWTEDVVRSILEVGDVQLFQGYYRLAHTDSVAAFNVLRLTELCTAVIDARGRTLTPRERAIAMKYSSQHGIYTRGDGAWKR